MSVCLTEVCGRPALRTGVGWDVREVTEREKRQGFHLTKDRPVGEISAHMQ